jgi:hypothetical protein
VGKFTGLKPSFLYFCNKKEMYVTLTNWFQEHRLMLFENRVLRRIFEPKRDEVTGEWGKLHSEELHDLYCPPTVVWAIKFRRII